jgi:hypothetical protein
MPTKRSTSFLQRGMAKALATILIPFPGLCRGGWQGNLGEI